MSDQYWLNDQMDADDGMSSFLNLGGGNSFSQQSQAQSQPQQQDDFAQFNEFGDSQDFNKLRQTSGGGLSSFGSVGTNANSSSNASASIDPMSILEKMHRQQKSISGDSSEFGMQDPQLIMRQHSAASTPAASSFSPSMMNHARVQMPQQNQLQQQQLMQQQQLQQQRAMSQRQQQAQKQQQQQQQQQQRVQQQQQNSRQQAFQQMQRQQQVQQMQQQQQHSFVQSPEQLGSQISTPMSDHSHIDTNQAMRQQANAYQQRMASMPVQHQQGAFQQPQFTQPATGMAQAAHMPQQSPQSPQAQNRQRQMNQAQMNQAQAELFMMTLSDFLRQRGVQMPPTPVIDGKKVPLFFLYLLVSRLGGSDQVTKTGKWPFVAAKFTINVENNISAVREVEHVYRQVLLPFEQYAATPQGQKDLHQKKMYLQQQLQARYQQRQQMQNQSQPPTPVQSVPQPQHALSQQMPFQQQQQQPPQRSFTAPSPMLNQQKIQQQQQRTSSVSSPQSMIVPNQRNSPAEFVPSVIANRSSEPSPMSAQPVQAQAKSKVASRKSSGSKSIAEPPAPQATPPPPVEIVRNYVPFQKLIELNGAYDVKMLAQLSDQIDQARPVFLFAPELSSVDVHALTMSLFSGLDSEINTALNTLLVVSTDNNLMIPITECPDLLEALTAIGTTTLKKLVGSHSDDDDADFKYKPGPNTLSSQQIQSVFEEYMASVTPGEDIPVTVNSFTAGDVSKDVVVYPDQDNILVDADDSELEDDEEAKSEASPPSSPDTPSDFDLTYFDLPQYMDVLIKCREETEDVFSEIHKRSHNDNNIMLVEQLSTITMILRNLSFLERNSHFFAHSHYLLDFVFDLLYEIAAHPEKLIFSRKRLCFIKDVALLFTNIAHLVHLRSAKEALLMIMLTTSLGGELKPTQKEEGLLIPEYLPQFHKYQPYGIDILSKLMVRDVPNKQLLTSVITGEIRLDNSVPLSIAQKETVKMIKLYAGEPKNGQLLTQIFSFFLSIVPMNLLAGGVGAISERSVTIYEALVGARMLVEMITIENFKDNLALQWLSTPERIGSGLLNLGFSLAAIAVKTRDNVKFGQIASESIGLLNSLLAKAIEYTEITEHGAAELASLPKLFPTVENFVGSIVTAGTDPRVKAEAVTLAKNISKLNSLVPNDILE